MHRLCFSLLHRDVSQLAFVPLIISPAAAYPRVEPPPSPRSLRSPSLQAVPPRSPYHGGSLRCPGCPAQSRYPAPPDVAATLAARARRSKARVAHQEGAQERAGLPGSVRLQPRLAECSLETSFPLMALRLSSMQANSLSKESANFWTPSSCSWRVTWS
jgi:hypothetical protein